MKPIYVTYKAIRRKPKTLSQGDTCNTEANIGQYNHPRSRKCVYKNSKHLLFVFRPCIVDLYIFTFSMSLDESKVIYALMHADLTGLVYSLQCTYLAQGEMWSPCASLICIHQHASIVMEWKKRNRWKQMVCSYIEDVRQIHTMLLGSSLIYID